MRKDNSRFVTVDKLLRDMYDYEEKNWDLCVACEISDDEEGVILGVIGVELDSDDDLCLHIEERDGFEEDDGYYSVADLISVLNGCNKTKKVYLAGHGILLSFDLNANGAPKSGINEDNDSLSYDISALGENEVIAENKSVSKPRWNNLGEDIALAVLALFGLTALGYNLHGLITKTGTALWEQILWIAASAIVVAVCGLTLYYSNGKEFFYNSNNHRRIEI